jgi:UDP-N-acetylglucosamine 4,6-dehydratase
MEKSEFSGKKILVTGGTGSFGRAFIKKVLTEHDPEKVIVFSRDEWKQWEMKKSDPVFADERLRYFLGDVRDKERLMRAFDGVDYVVHAAALKQVPVAEYNPSEFVKTNVLGAMNIIDAAIDCGVQKVVALSTDKAVNPVNLYGATKLCSDKIFVGGSVYVGTRGYPLFSVVRYGNVLGSRGSIIPLWKEMLQDGAKEIPVTDDRMTRFWITLSQAAEFVIEAFRLTQGGEIFVPKIPSMLITDLATAMAPDVPQRMIGIREGEKLHEVMIGEDDSRHSLEFPDHYVILPQVLQKEEQKKYCQPVSDLTGEPLRSGFVYASDTNSRWLEADGLKRLIDEQLK